MKSPTVPKACTERSRSVPPTITNVINLLAKVMSVPIPPARQPFGFTEKISTPHCVRVVFFRKALHVGNTH